MPSSDALLDPAILLTGFLVGALLAGLLSDLWRDRL